MNDFFLIHFRTRHIICVSTIFVQWFRACANASMIRKKFVCAEFIFVDHFLSNPCSRQICSNRLNRCYCREMSMLWGQLAWVPKLGTNNSQTLIALSNHSLTKSCRLDVLCRIETRKTTIYSVKYALYLHLNIYCGSLFSIKQEQFERPNKN